MAKNLLIFRASALVWACATLGRAAVNGPTCAIDNDCDQGFQCVDSEGYCRLPPDWKGDPKIPCSSHIQCESQVTPASQCQTIRQGVCLQRQDLCRYEERWLQSCPPGMSCDNRRCVRHCTVGGHRDQCGVDEQCCSTGICSRNCPQRSSCTAFNPAGSCPPGQTCQRGVCKNAGCSPDNHHGICLNGRICVKGVCQEDYLDTKFEYTQPAQYQHDDHRHHAHLDHQLHHVHVADHQHHQHHQHTAALAHQHHLQHELKQDLKLHQSTRHSDCSLLNPEGQCHGRGQTCVRGICLSYNECSANDWNGVCPHPDEVCKNGICVPRHHSCSVVNPHGFCAPGEVCQHGHCVYSGVPHHGGHLHNRHHSPLIEAVHPVSDCRVDGCLNGKLCVRHTGRCAHACSHHTPHGACAQEGHVCVLGVCQAASCSLVLCPPGAVCRHGHCERATDAGRGPCRPGLPGECPGNTECVHGACVPRKIGNELQVHDGTEVNLHAGHLVNGQLPGAVVVHHDHHYPGHHHH